MTAIKAPPIRIAVVGVGKIARDQHLPAIAASPDFTLAAVVDHHDPHVAAPWFATMDALLDHGPPVDAVVLCTPPQVRYGLAAAAIGHGLHVFLEKPPGATLAEVELLRTAAHDRGVSLFAAWHSRFAAGVQPARTWLASRIIRSVRIVWREDARVWHPGQAWIWQAGGLGVFDPGINALSIATAILPHPFFLTRATLLVPANRAAPIAADLVFSDCRQTPITMDLDWRQTGPQTWDIMVETDAGRMELTNGGGVMTVSQGVQHGTDSEYAGLYRRFAALVQTHTSDVDITPLRHVADAFLLGQRISVDAFVD